MLADQTLEKLLVGQFAGKLFVSQFVVQMQEAQFHLVAAWMDQQTEMDSLVVLVAVMMEEQRESVSAAVEARG